jgi:DNA-binding NarL/FixJ family response regulator
MFMEMLQRRLTRAGMQVVATAVAGMDVLELIATHQPDVLILDIGLPDISGLEVAQEVHAAYPEVAVLLLTGYAPRTVVSFIGQQGVRGYVHKTASGVELLAAVRAVAEGRLAIGPGTTRPQLTGESDELTALEHQVLQLLAAGQHSREIAAILHTSIRTVERQLRQLRLRLHARSLAELAIRAEQHGWLAPTNDGR